MIVFIRSTIRLTQSERMELSQRATSRSGRADDGRRARLILLLEAAEAANETRSRNAAKRDRALCGLPTSKPLTLKNSDDAVFEA
jgi:hypothetical protein